MKQRNRQLLKPCIRDPISTWSPHADAQNGKGVCGMSDSVSPKFGGNSPNDTIEQLKALRGLLSVEDDDGRRVLYQEDETGDHCYYHLCREVDGHKSGCAIEVAERTLRLIQASS